MIHYVTSWARKPEEHNLRQFPAASTKSEYVAEALKSVAGDQTVKVLSLAQTLHRKWYYAPRMIERIDEKEIDEVIPSIGSPIRLIRGINIIILNMYLFFYLLFSVKKKDTVVIYHSCDYIIPIKLAKRIKHFFFILEVEEIYQHVRKLSNRQKRAEYDVFELASSYIFSTNLLEEAINHDRKPAIVVHGTYKVETDRNTKFRDGKIHVVYAGTLNPKKGGAMAAAAVVDLPENYHVHILGHGTRELIEQMISTVKRSSVYGGAKVTYDGFYSGEEYIRFIQACDIGLSTQYPDAKFNATSFPSKILSYMSNGLHVVSVRIEAVETSAVGDMITYYEEQTSKSIANAIMSIDLSEPYDSRLKIEKLDKQFQKELKQLIEAKR